MATKFTAIVLAAGTGKRMNSDTPKQYLPILGKPVLYYSLKAFQESPVTDIILVTGADEVDYCLRNIVKPYGLTKVTQIIPGGNERYDSVYAGLQAAEGSDYVMIHDGARPLVDITIINRSINMVQLEKACVVGMPVKDTIRVVDGTRHAVETPERSLVWQIQTPQSFSFPYIKEAYDKMSVSRGNGEDLSDITDDAMVIERYMKGSVKLIEGSYRNLKITTPEDLKLAEELIKRQG